MTDPAKFFDDMAGRIRKNASDEFAGALLVVPPGGEAPIEILLVDPNQDLANFWAVVGSKIQVAAGQFQERMRNPDPFGRR